MAAVLVSAIEGLEVITALSRNRYGINVTSPRREPLERKVMNWQEWRGFVVGIFASLGLIGCAGAGAARVAVTPQSFDLPKEEGVAAHATVAPQSEASFDLPKEEGVAAHATVAPQVEASFDLPKEEGVAAHAAVASPSAVQFGL